MFPPTSQCFLEEVFLFIISTVTILKLSFHMRYQYFNLDLILSRCLSGLTAVHEVNKNLHSQSKWKHSLGQDLPCKWLPRKQEAPLSLKFSQITVFQNLLNSYEHSEHFFFERWDLGVENQLLYLGRGWCLCPMALVNFLQPGELKLRIFFFKYLFLRDKENSNIWKCTGKSDILVQILRKFCLAT